MSVADLREGEWFEKGRLTPDEPVWLRAVFVLPWMGRHTQSNRWLLSVRCSGALDQTFNDWLHKGLAAYGVAVWIEVLVMADQLCGDFYARLLGLHLPHGDGDLRALGHGDRLETLLGAGLG